MCFGSSSRHGLWWIVSCGGGGTGTDGGVRGFFISSPLCSEIWMSASSKCHSCQALIIVNGFHLLLRSCLHQVWLNKELDQLHMSTLHLIQWFKYWPSLIKSKEAICRALFNLLPISGRGKIILFKGSSGPRFQLELQQINKKGAREKLVFSYWEIVQSVSAPGYHEGLPLICTLLPQIIKSLPSGHLLIFVTP